MKALSPVLLLAALGVAGGCDRPPIQAGAVPPSGPVAANTTAPSDPASPNTSAPTPAPATGVAGAVNDTITTGKIKAAIAADAGMRDSDVSVTTREGVVTLSGSVKSEDQVTIAIQLAQRQQGVRRVENAITVR